MVSSTPLQLCFPVLDSHSLKAAPLASPLDIFQNLCVPNLADTGTVVNSEINKLIGKGQFNV